MPTRVGGRLAPCWRDLRPSALRMLACNWHYIQYSADGKRFFRFFGANASHSNLSGEGPPSHDLQAQLF